MVEKNNDTQQYLGFLETAPIFTSETNPFSQALFTLKNTAFDGVSDLQLKNNLMLGKRAEAFFKYQIEKTEEHLILIENIQIQKDKITLGELDIILEEKETFKKIHVEISYKFYLYDPTIEGEEIKKWIGPNRNDDLIKKVSKLQTHQFPLLYSKEAKKTFTQLDVEQIEQQIFFKAQLFIPFHLKNKPFNAINSKAIRGYYYSYSEFVRKNHSAVLFFIPSKQDWLALPSSNKIWKTFDEISVALQQSIEKQKSPLIWTKKNESDYESLFITWW